MHRKPLYAQLVYRLARDFVQTPVTAGRVRVGARKKKALRENISPFVFNGFKKRFRVPNAKAYKKAREHFKSHSIVKSHAVQHENIRNGKECSDHVMWME